MWKPVEHPWQYDLLDRLPSGVDATLIDEALSITPTQRIEKAVAMMRLAEALRAARERR
ncbi:MAG: hypothetical protein SFX73_18425 [Kofleriaceae bacterium]|nr:hypothetical protein [Kofleriaceae bacterium]